MNKKAYLERIGVGESALKVDIDTLNLLQLRHLLSVPFENLDIHWKRPIILNTERFFDKIVGERRGGFCYELNGLFSGLLTEVGFENKIVSARVTNGNGGFSPEYDHLAIIANVGGAEFLVDVGFGSFIGRPLKFVPDIEQTDPCGVFLIRRYDEQYFEVVKKTEMVGSASVCLVCPPATSRNLKECAIFIKLRPSLIL